MILLIGAKSILRLEEVKMKLIFALFLSVWLLGCTSGHPVPPEAFKDCHDAGGTPAYKSGTNHTQFICVQPGGELKNF